MLENAGTKPEEWEAQLQEMAHEHLEGAEESQVAQSHGKDSPFGADVTVRDTPPKKRSWLGGKAADKAAKPTGKLQQPPMMAS